MRNKLLILILIISMIFIFAGCKKTEDIEVAGIVMEISENGDFKVQVIGGYQEDFMLVHITDKVKYEEGVDKVATLGSAVGFTIKDEVMETYPVQAIAKKIRWNESIIKGKILSAGEDSILIQVTEGFEGKMLQVHITEDTIFYNNIPKIVEKGKEIGFTSIGDIIKTEPQQVNVKRIVIYN